MHEGFQWVFTQSFWYSLLWFNNTPSLQVHKSSFCLQTHHGCLQTHRGCLHSQPLCMRTHHGCMQKHHGCMHSQLICMQKHRVCMQTHRVCLHKHTLWYRKVLRLSKTLLDLLINTSQHSVYHCNSCCFSNHLVHLLRLVITPIQNLSYFVVIELFE